MLIDTIPETTRQDWSPDARELAKRMTKPQRHRLLHGYPLAGAMPVLPLPYREEILRADGGLRFPKKSSRGLLVGVLPHSFCNPTVRGCGFCTFPHDRYRASKARVVVERVIQEIDERLAAEPALFGRQVSGLYFGGGTANLTPVDVFRRLCRKLNEVFDFSQAEVSLEGVPNRFLQQKPLLVDVMREELAARHFRISMGIQTFDEGWLRRMGRHRFGTRTTFEDVASLAHERGMTVSGDLLFNLPRQTRREMKRDVETAIEIGLDHLGLYHLVLFRGIGTAWSQDRGLLAGLPTNRDAARHWLALRDLLLENGFRQTTLTNFEREHFGGAPRRFVYEEHSFHADRFDMLGFGPSAISASARVDFRGAWKTLNPDSSDGYVQTPGDRGHVFDRYFDYKEEDLRVFYLTRRFAALRIDRHEYRRLFEDDPLEHFPREFAALENERLIRVDDSTLAPTPQGMFYADSIAALLAWRRIAHRRTQANIFQIDGSGRPDDNGSGHM